MRSCSACRRKADARDLLRVTLAPDGNPVFDWRRNLGGRGAHVCPNRACIVKAIERRCLDRAFRARVRYPEPRELIDTARAALDRQIETLIGAAVRSRNLTAGTDAVLRALAAGQSECLLVASDASARERFVEAATAAEVACWVLSSKNELGALAGRGETGVLSIDSHGLAAAIGQAITRMESLGDESPGND